MLKWLRAVATYPKREFMFAVNMVLRPFRGFFQMTNAAKIADVYKRAWQSANARDEAPADSRIAFEAAVRKLGLDRRDIDIALENMARNLEAEAVFMGAGAGLMVWLGVLSWTDVLSIVMWVAVTLLFGVRAIVCAHRAWQVRSRRLAGLVEWARQRVRPKP